MVKRVPWIVFLVLFFVTPMVPYAWGEGRQITIIYSNNINGQIYPAG